MNKINVVQLGANAGDDHVSDFIRDYKEDIDTALLVEPIEEVANECREFYKNRGDNNVVVHTCAISDSDGTAELTYIPGQTRLSSLEPGMHIDFLNPATTTMTVSTLTLDSLFKKYKLNKVDVLFIDTEGFDENILSNYDFDKYQTGFIVWEWNHSQRRNIVQHVKLIQKLQANSYSIVKVGMNMLATKINTTQYKTTIGERHLGWSKNTNSVNLES
jgi:FkbM family methyltransferase